MKRLAAVLAAAAALAACGSGRLVRRGAINEDAMAQVRRTLPAIRRLAFTAPVPAHAMDRAEIRGLLEADLDASYEPGDLERIAAVYGRLGLLPPGTALRPALLRLYEEEGAGFYDPRTKELVLTTRAQRAAGVWVDLYASLTGHDLVGEFLVAHELTHALQDQHYGLPTEPEPLAAADGDRQLARRALLEGDATLAGFAYLLGGALDGATLARVEREVATTPARLAERFPEVPPLVRATLAFQYVEGTAFVGHALREDGWPAVDRAHGAPPESTEQVLHPARFELPRDRPVAIALGGTEALAANGWATILEDTLGELQIRILAARALPASEAARVAGGWGGDRIRALGREEALVLVWMTAWDADIEAEEFTAALPAVVPGARVERRAERVLVLLGPEEGAAVDLGALAARVWAGTTAARPG